MSDNASAAEAELGRKGWKMNPRWRPSYHITAPAGWLSDPNGVSWFAGYYHVFYQHYPYSSEWGLMHWGHAMSPDLVHWRHVGIALTPGDPYDKNGCYSGSAVDNDGEFTLVYTGHNFVEPDPLTHDRARFTQNQNIAVSRDGVNFVKYAGNPVIAEPPPDGTHHFRDPKVWRHEGAWYMVLGNAGVDGRARAILYRSADLRNWDYLGPLAESDATTGSMWECPDLFELDGRHVLAISPIGMKAVGDDNLNQHQTGSLVGSFDYSTHRLSHGTFSEMDRGHDFYAIQTTQDPDGRRIGIGWMQMWDSAMPEQVDGWAGALTLPRELHVTEDNHLTMQPVAELEHLRVDLRMSRQVSVGGELDTGLEVGTAEILLDVQFQGAQRVGFRLDIGDQRYVTVCWDEAAGKLELDRGGVDGVRRAPFAPGDALRLRVFVDRSSIEVFTDSGLVTITSRFYPSHPPTLELFSDGGVSQFSVEVFSLQDIWHDAGNGHPDLETG